MSELCEGSCKKIVVLTELPLNLIALFIQCLVKVMIVHSFVNPPTGYLFLVKIEISGWRCSLTLLNLLIIVHYLTIIDH